MHAYTGIVYFSGNKKWKRRNDAPTMLLAQSSFLFNFRNYAPLPFASFRRMKRKNFRLLFHFVYISAVFSLILHLYIHWFFYSYYVTAREKA